MKTTTRFNLPVVIQEPSTHADERQHEIQAEQMPFDQFPASVCHSSTPWATDFEVGVSAKEVYREVDSEWPRQIE